MLSKFTTSPDPLPQTVIECFMDRHRARIPDAYWRCECENLDADTRELLDLIKIDLCICNLRWGYLGMDGFEAHLTTLTRSFLRACRVHQTVEPSQGMWR